MFQSSVFLWVLLAAFFVGIELATVALLTIWFAGGSLAAAAVSILGGPFWLQVVVFLAVSAGLLAVLRPILAGQKKSKTNLDSIIGSQGLVTEDINNITAQGQVKLGAMTWSARSTSGESIPKGTQVAVDRIEGVKVFVSPVSVPCK